MWQGRITATKIHTNSATVIERKPQNSIEAETLSGNQGTKPQNRNENLAHNLSNILSDNNQFECYICKFTFKH